MTKSKKAMAKTDAVNILHDRYFRDKPTMLALLEKERANADIAQQIYELRTKVGLSQRQLAELVGTQASAICRLEDADYHGHSLFMLQRIALALNKRVQVRFVPLKSKRKTAAKRRASR